MLPISISNNITVQQLQIGQEGRAVQEGAQAFYKLANLQVQGSEADATVLSLVKTQPDLTDFFGDVRRACVALSRAKYISVIVGSKAVFQSSGSSSNNNEGVKLWQKIMQMYK
eukprot:1094280-Pelagomonas_calceolata.AAC.3